MASSAKDGRIDTALSFDPGVVSFDLYGCDIQLFTVVVQCPTGDGHRYSCLLCRMPVM